MGCNFIQKITPNLEQSWINPWRSTLLSLPASCSAPYTPFCPASNFSIPFHRWQLTGNTFSMHLDPRLSERLSSLCGQSGEVNFPCPVPPSPVRQRKMGFMSLGIMGHFRVFFRFFFLWGGGEMWPILIFVGRWVRAVISGYWRPPHSQNSYWCAYEVTFLSFFLFSQSKNTHHKCKRAGRYFTQVMGWRPDFTLCLPKKVRKSFVISGWQNVSLIYNT